MDYDNDPEPRDPQAVRIVELASDRRALQSRVAELQAALKAAYRELRYHATDPSGPDLLESAQARVAELEREVSELREAKDAHYCEAESQRGARVHAEEHVAELEAELQKEKDRRIEHMQHNRALNEELQQRRRHEPR